MEIVTVQRVRATNGGYIFTKFTKPDGSSLSVCTENMQSAIDTLKGKRYLDGFSLKKERKIIKEEGAWIA